MAQRPPHDKHQSKTTIRILKFAGDDDPLGIIDGVYSVRMRVGGSVYDVCPMGATLVVKEVSGRKLVVEPNDSKSVKVFLRGTN